MIDKQALKPALCFMPYTSLRRQSRELALKLLHQIGFTKTDLPQAFQNFKTAFFFPEKVWPYATDLILGVQENQEDILNLIKNKSKNWRLNRIALIDLHILSIAIFELKFSKEEIDKATIIDEALEVSKKYSSEKSPAFINGILDKVI